MASTQPVGVSGDILFLKNFQRLIVHAHIVVEEGKAKMGVDDTFLFAKFFGQFQRLLDIDKSRVEGKVLIGTVQIHRCVIPFLS